jgi:hypothetical protein
MNPYETTYNGQSPFIRDAKSLIQRGLARTKSLPWIALLSLLVLVALPNAIFAQRPSRGERPPADRPRPQVEPVAQPDTQTNAPIVIGTSTQTVKIPGTLHVGERMQVVNSAIGGGVWARNLYIHQLNQMGSPAHLCWKGAPDGVQGLLITVCTSSQSSLRYKTDLQPFLGGLSVINRLKPYNFAWKKGGMREVGLIAEDVAEVEPLLTFKNERDEIEGVKYENLNVVFINAFKEQQTQIEELRQQIKAQQEHLKQQAQQIEALKKLVSP